MHVVKAQQSPDRFEDFWTIYPKHVGKLVAKAKWDKITNGGLSTRTLDRDSGSYVSLKLQASADQLIEGAKRYRATQIDPKKCRSDDYDHIVLKDDGRYTCNPSTWLNQGRWMDDY
jgi:hypothetical protein